MRLFSSLFLVFISLLFCADDDKLKIANAIKNASKEHNVDKRLLYTIAKIESNFTPNIIAFVSPKKFHIFSKNFDVSVKNIPYDKKYLVQIRAERKCLEIIARKLIENGFSIDMGIMQINSANVSQSELPYIFDIDFNIKKSIDILNFCANKKNHIKKSIECYNKGVRKTSNFSYFKKFAKSFKKDFT